MAVYLGNQGSIELQRDSFNTPLSSDLNPDDVNSSKNRFSFDFDPGALITGDQVDIETTDGSELELVSGHTNNEGWRGYISVDDAGGIKLYTTFEAAVSGNAGSALSLVVPSRTIPIQVSTRSSVFRCLAQVQEYEITDIRETIDITSLGEEFRRNYANGLISGQGSMRCFWDYKSSECNGMIGESVEFPHYLAQLVIRLQQGADFVGRFFLHMDANDRGVWQEAKCIVTNVAISVSPTQLITTTVQFVTTGEISLQVGTPPAYLLLQNSSKVLQEDDYGVLLEDDS